MSEKAGDGNQWNTDGDCDICRRRKYCGKPCTVKKRHDEQIMSLVKAKAANLLRPELIGGHDEKI